MSMMKKYIRVNNMAKAKLLLKNDVGLVLDITESPLGCTVYDLEGNEIGGGGGENLQLCTLTVINETGNDIAMGINNISDSGLYVTGLDAENNATVTVNAIYSDDGDNIFIELWDIEAYDQILSDAVNCTIDPRGGKLYRPAPGASSATLTLKPL